VLVEVIDSVVSIGANSPALPLLIQHCVIMLTERIRTTLGSNADVGFGCAHDLVADGCALSFKAGVH
jgi:hypothetical protein